MEAINWYSLHAHSGVYLMADEIMKILIISQAIKSMDIFQTATRD